MNETEFHRLDLGVTKCYLIKCLSGHLLVDTGYSSDEYNRIAAGVLAGSWVHASEESG